MAWMKLTFKTTPEGKQVYFPWGSFGAGYEVRSDAQEQAIRRYHRISTVIGLPLILATAAAWRLDADLLWRLLGLALVAAHLSHYAWQVQQWDNVLHRSTLELTHKEVREQRLATMSPVLLWFFFGLCLVIALWGIALIVSGWGVGAGFFFLFLFGGFAALFGWMLTTQHRIKQAAAE
jgi:hypothetical protein